MFLFFLLFYVCYILTLFYISVPFTFYTFLHLIPFYLFTCLHIVYTYFYSFTFLYLSLVFYIFAFPFLFRFLCTFVFVHLFTFDTYFLHRLPFCTFLFIFPGLLPFPYTVCLFLHYYMSVFVLWFYLPFYLFTF